MRPSRHTYTVYDPSYVYAPWKKWVALAVLVIAVGGVVWFVIANKNQQLNDDRQPLPETPAVSINEPAVTDVPQEEPKAVLDKIYYSVVKVVDGDTIDVVIDGTTERLRLIGINTPETVDPRKTVQCFGKEASGKAKSLLTGAKVSLEQDSSQGERDTYGRLLVYVFLEDGTHFNQYMIAEGYAHEYTYRIPYKYQAEFKAAQASARANEKGLWSSSTCGGNT